jgi:hypothetical protein
MQRCRQGRPAKHVVTQGVQDKSNCRQWVPQKEAIDVPSWRCISLSGKLLEDAEIPSCAVHSQLASTFPNHACAVAFSQVRRSNGSGALMV